MKIATHGRFWVQLIDRQTLIRYMEYRGESCSTLARKVGCHRSLIGHLRSGHRRTCQPLTARAIEKALNAPPGSLFVERHIMPRASTVQRVGSAA